MHFKCGTEEACRASRAALSCEARHRAGRQQTTSAAKVRNASKPDTVYRPLIKLQQFAKSYNSAPFKRRFIAMRHANVRHNLFR